MVAQNNSLLESLPSLCPLSPHVAAHQKLPSTEEKQDGQCTMLAAGTDDSPLQMKLNLRLQKVKGRVKKKRQIINILWIRGGGSPNVDKGGGGEVAECG